MTHFAGLRVFVVPRMALAITFALLIALGSLCGGNSSFAGTPHSTPKSCGYQGGPTCPHAAVDISAYRYYGTGAGYTSPYYFDIGEVMPWFVAKSLSGGWCNATYPSPTFV